MLFLSNDVRLKYQEQELSNATGQQVGGITVISQGCVALEAGCYRLEQTPSRRIAMQNFRVNPKCLNLNSRSTGVLKPLRSSRII